MHRTLPIALSLLLPGCLSWQVHHDPDLALGRPVRTVAADEVRYDDVGEGEAVLLIHGFGSSLESWESVVPGLCEGRRCIRADLKGFGLSSRYEGDYSPRAQGAMLLGLLDQLGVDQAHLIAHSYGCAVALQIAVDHPDRVRSLVLNDAFAYHEQVPWFFAWSQPAGVGELLFGLYYDQQLDYRVPLSFHDDSYVTHDMVTRARQALRHPGSRRAALQAARDLDLTEVERTYHGIDRPVLLIWGGRDTVTPLRYGERLAQHLPRAELHVVEYAGHFPMVEAAEAWVGRVDSFLTEVGR